MYVHNQSFSTVCVLDLCQINSMFSQLVRCFHLLMTFVSKIRRARYECRQQNETCKFVIRKIQQIRMCDFRANNLLDKYSLLFSYGKHLLKYFYYYIDRIIRDIIARNTVKLQIFCFYRSCIFNLCYTKLNEIYIKFTLKRKNNKICGRSMKKKETINEYLL